MATRRSSRQRRVVPAAAKQAVKDEGDDDFWGQDAFAEDEDDKSFDENEQSDRGEDIVDSDFDAPEDAGDAGDGGEGALRAAERRSSRKGRAGRYVDPALKAAASAKRKAPPPAAGASGAASAGTTTTTTKKPRTARPSFERSSLRKSTKKASAEADERRAQKAAEEEKRRIRKAARDAKRPKVKIPTQAELLEEAKETEIENKESLQDLLRLEEERKRLPVKKEKKKGAVMSVRSRDGKTTISLTDAKADARKAIFPHLGEESKPAEKVPEEADSAGVKRTDVDMKDTAEDKAAGDNDATGGAETENGAAVKATTEKVATENAVAENATTENAASENAATEKTVAEVTATEKAAPEKADQSDAIMSEEKDTA